MFTVTMTKLSNKDKFKLFPTTGYEGREVQQTHNSALSLISALVVKVMLRPLYPWKRDTIPIIREAG